MKPNILRYFFSFTFLFFILTAQAIENKGYLRTKALPGDGIYSLLRRYSLDKYSCNFQEFYRINKIKKNAHLSAGKEYLLPIIRYHFNGKTIRSSIGINDWDLAVNIQKYNEEMHAKEIRPESFKVDRDLWVPFHILNCPSGNLNIPSPVNDEPELLVEEEAEEENPPIPPANRGRRTFPIFGDKYAYTPLVSNALRGKVYYVVAGHGGPDPGAIGKRGKYTLCEDEYAYDVALRLCRHLIAHGATAYMIMRDPNDGIRSGQFLKCDIDEVLWGGIKMVRQQKPRLFQRSDVINDLYRKHRLKGVADQKLIIIHVDSRSKGERTDLFFYHKPGSKASKTLATNLQKEMKRKYRQYQRNRPYKGTVTARDLHMLRETEPTSVYIELGNIRNSFDQQRIILESNRRAIAKWLFDGLR